MVTLTLIYRILTLTILLNSSLTYLLLTLSEHFSQFISVNREKIDLKSINIYQRDHSKFSNESFQDDVSIQTWNYAHENIHQAFKDFYTKLEDSVSNLLLLQSSFLSLIIIIIIINIAPFFS